MGEWKEEIRRRLAGLKLEPVRESEIVEELSQHLDDRYRELLAGGASETEARRVALAELSESELLHRELHRVERRVEQEPVVFGTGSRNIMADILQDLRFGIRMLRKNPGFTFVAVMTLALGIGANTAIFSVVNAVLLRPLPYSQPDRLATFWLTSPEGLRKMEWTEGLVAYFRDHSQSFEMLAAYDGGSGFNLTGRGEPGRLNGATVTYDFFRALGKEPLQGRTFLPEEDTPGNNNVAVLSYDLWQQRFDGDSQMIGQSISLNDVPTVVVGIMPPGFDFPNRADLWVPVGLNTQGFNHWYIEPIGRLKPGVTTADAERETAVLWSNIAHERGLPQTGPEFLISVKPLTQLVVGEVRTPLLILLGAAGFVLLIACANIANLLLARSAARSREIAMRCCLGASSHRIIRQLLTESLLLVVMGTGVGLLMAFWSVEALKRLSLGDTSRIEQLDLLAVPLPRIDQAQIDMNVLLFAFAVALLTGLIFGSVPALRAARVNLNEAMKEGARGSASISNRKFNNAFVIAQVALSLVLLVGAGLLIQSFRNLLAVDPGFRPENVWVGRLELPEARYDDDKKVRNFYEQLLDRAQAMPGVRAAGLCQRLPFYGGGDGNMLVAEGYVPAPDEMVPITWWRDVSPDYFKAMGIPVLKGRPFQATDTESSLRVAIVDEKFANLYWPDQDPVGKRIHFPWNNESFMTVIGVVASVKHSDLDEDSRPYVYWPVSQDIRLSMYLVIRTESDPETITSAVHTQVSNLDPQLPIFEISTMEQMVARSLTTRRLTDFLLTGFAVTALALALIGIYGVMSLNVTSRTNEFGIRLALGASPASLLRLVVGHGMRLALIGTVLGLGGAFWLTQFLESLLFKVKPFDLPIFTGVALMLCLAAMAACYIPARRAMRVDPIVALRNE